MTTSTDRDAFFERIEEIIHDALLDWEPDWETSSSVSVKAAEKIMAAFDIATGK